MNIYTQRTYTYIHREHIHKMHKKIRGKGAGGRTEGGGVWSRRRRRGWGRGGARGDGDGVGEGAACAGTGSACVAIGVLSRWSVRTLPVWWTAGPRGNKGTPWLFPRPPRGEHGGRPHSRRYWGCAGASRGRAAGAARFERYWGSTLRSNGSTETPWSRTVRDHSRALNREWSR